MKRLWLASGALGCTALLAACAVPPSQGLLPYTMYVNEKAMSINAGTSCWAWSLAASASETQYLLQANIDAGIFATPYQADLAQDEARESIRSFNENQGWRSLIANYCHPGDRIFIPNDGNAYHRVHAYCDQTLPITRADPDAGYATCTLAKLPVVSD